MKIEHDGTFTDFGEEVFGGSLHLDLFKCRYLPYLSCDVMDLVYEIVEKIGMKFEERPTAKYYIGRDSFTEGWSVVGLLTTSSFSMHTCTKTRNIHIDIFSCKEIELVKLVLFLNKKLEPQEMAKMHLSR